MSVPKTILHAERIEKEYPSGSGMLKVLKGIDLEIREGELLVIMGPSGAGKSTLLHILGTLDRPTSGKLMIDGQDTAALSEKELSYFRNHNIGFVFQFHYLLPEFTARENLMIPGMIGTKSRKAGFEEIHRLLKDVGLADRAHHRPSQLSGGEQQRVAMARALVNRPKLVLADEPTGNLDSRNSKALFNLIMSLKQKYNQTFVIVTHSAMFAEQADRVIHLLDGKINRTPTAG